MAVLNVPQRPILQQLMWLRQISAGSQGPRTVSSETSVSKSLTKARCGLALILIAARVSACPVCNSGSGRQVRQSTVVNLEINTFWDRLFHSLTWLATAYG